MYYIYKIKNKKTGQCYVGQTISIDERIRSHISSNKSKIGKDIKRYGKENFEITVLYIAETLQEANEKEKQYIISEKALYPNGYNRNLGGRGLKGQQKIYQYDINGNLLNIFDNILLACDSTKTSRTSILGCIAGTYKKANGYIWLKESNIDELEKRVKNVAIAKCLIIQYDKDMNEIARYNSCSEAQRKLGLGEKRYKVIFSALDTNKKAFGYYWKRQ